MAVGTVKSVNITQMDTLPLNPLNKKVGIERVQIDQIALPTTATDDVGDITLLCAIPSNAVLTELSFLNDALAASGLAFNIGLYYSGRGHNSAALVAGAAADADCIATGKVITSANVTFQDVRFEADNIINISKELWEVAGLTSDPGGLFHIGFTVSVVATTPTAGDLVVKAKYIV